MCYKPPYTITTKMIGLVSEISYAIASIELDERSLITPKLRKKNRIKTLAGTLEIEGNLLGEEKITAILNGKRVLGTVAEVSEVEGAIAAYERLSSYNVYDVKDLQTSHKILMKNILRDAGRFRTRQVSVGEHVAPPSERVPALMNDLFEWLEKTDEHPLIKSSVFHYEFEFIHPFFDGNGRIGRLWQTAILYQWKSAFSLIPTESIIRDNQDDYYLALERSGRDGTSTLFIEFMLQSILDAVKSSVKSSVKKFGKTDVEVLEYFRSNPTGTIKEIAEMLHLTKRAVEKQVAALKSKNLLSRTGSSRNGYWSVKNKG
ncbi:MAG: Fic family protein [Kiritimatiellae bacterium]|nr:Fic family protein [Kiritimatiellia bacterium]